MLKFYHFCNKIYFLNYIFVEAIEIKNEKCKLILFLSLEGGRHSPDTEDEAVSEFEVDEATSKKEEYSLPQPICQIFYTKV